MCFMYNYNTYGVTVSEDLTPIKSILTKVSPKIFNHVTSEKNLLLFINMNT